MASVSNFFFLSFLFFFFDWAHLLSSHLSLPLCSIIKKNKSWKSRGQNKLQYQKKEKQWTPIAPSGDATTKAEEKPTISQKNPALPEQKREKTTQIDFVSRGLVALGYPNKDSFNLCGEPLFSLRRVLYKKPSRLDASSVTFRIKTNILAPIWKLSI